MFNLTTWLQTVSPPALRAMQASLRDHAADVHADNLGCEAYHEHDNPERAAAERSNKRLLDHNPMPRLL